MQQKYYHTLYLIELFSRKLSVYKIFGISLNLLDINKLIRKGNEFAVCIITKNN